MKLFSVEDLKCLQKRPDCIRNICILAHVDHGKTTLADSLVASNGIISKRLAGKLRYMDSRKDEQERGITMKSSCISLIHLIEKSHYLINLIDSPGHVDFSGEVSAAVRLCDGCLILIDVVEGVCSQTQTALRQAWLEGLKPILVLNKMDRLILELKMEPLDAYLHLLQMVEQVNVIMGQLFMSDALLEESNEVAPKVEPRERINSKNETTEYTFDWSSGIDDKDDSDVYFSPEQGNVIFTSAADGWGFTAQQFSRILSQKHKMSEQALNKTLWGDFYLDMKRKRIMKGAQGKAKKPLFVQMVLDNIWAAYDAIAVRRDKPLIEKIVNSLGLNVPTRDLNHVDFRVQLQSIFGLWLPLATAILDVVCKQVPSPLQLEEVRAKRLMCPNLKAFESFPVETQALKDEFVRCSPNGAKIVCISKMVCVEKKFLPENRAKILTHEEIMQRREQAKQRLAQKATAESTQPEQTASPAGQQETLGDPAAKCQEEQDERNEHFIAFARIFSGTIKTGDQVYVMGPKYNPAQLNGDAASVPENVPLSELSSKQHITSVRVGRVFAMMGKELELLDEVPAGNVLGIEGLEGFVLKSATLSDNAYCPAFIDLHTSAQPILRVAIEPQNPYEIPQLIKGLQLLNQADPNVEVKLQDTGEHVIVTTGEVHLQKCIDDLTESFAQIELSVSAPIVPFRETIVHPPKIDMVNEAIDDSNAAYATASADGAKASANNETIIHAFTPNKKASIKVKAIPLPDEVTEWLESNSAYLKQLFSKAGQKQNISPESRKIIANLKERLAQLFEQAGGPWNAATVDKIWALGPKYCGSNILFNEMDNYETISPLEDNNNLSSAKGAGGGGARENLESSFVSGFQLATLAGPLCEEPMNGVGFVVQEWQLADEVDVTVADPFGPLSGQIMSTVKEGCRRAFTAQPQRLKLAMYSCTIQIASDALGKMYAVLGRRHGRVVHADLQEGSQMFNVVSVLPVIESFSLGDELRKQTSGLAQPQLLFSHWETLDLDPFWVPSTEEEYARFGEKADTENRARKYMNYVRRRKGLPVDEQIVEHAEKQRTLMRKK